MVFTGSLPPMASIGRGSGRAGRSRHQPQVRVVLERLRDRALDLPERRRGDNGDLRQRAAERLGHEVVGSLVQREGRSLARSAHDAAGRTGEADQVLALAAAGARAELGRQTGREQQLQAKRQRAGAAAGGTAGWGVARLFLGG